jgi:hypothetical protein
LRDEVNGRVKRYGTFGRLAGFLLVGIPSALLLTASIGVVTLFFFARWMRLSYGLLAVVGIALGGLGVLEATGNRAQWLHLVPFLAAPFFFFATLFASARLEIREPELVAAVVTIVVLVSVSRRIGRYYGRKRVGNAGNGA